MTQQRWSEACERNRDPILAVLRPYLQDRQRVLEIGSGTGQHAEFFAGQLPHLQWQASDHPDYLPGIAERLAEAALPNAPPPWPLQAVLGPQPINHIISCHSYRITIGIDSFDNIIHLTR